MLDKIKKKDVLERLGCPESTLLGLCNQYHIKKLEVFGSILREDFDDKSDIDLLVTFDSSIDMDLFLFARIRLAFCDLTGRQVDLIMRLAVEESKNPYRKKEILESAELLYAA